MFIALATAVVAMAGCQLKEEFTPEAERLVKGSFSIIDAETKSAAVTVTDEGDEIEAPETKTTLDTDGKSVKWSSTDRISVFDCLPRNRTFTLTSGAGSSSAQFDGLYADGTTVLYALYPQDSTATINGSVITTTIPATQNAVSGSFADKTNIAVGMAEPDPTTHAATTGMKNAAMYFKFKVPAAMTSLQSVTLTAGGNVKLVGQVSVDAAAESPAATVVSNGNSTITLTGISAGKTYYMVSAVTNLTSGFTITVTSSSETVTRTITKSFTGARGKVFDLSDLAFSASASGSVAHNYDASSYLTGSTMTITPNFPDGGISSWTAKIYDKNGTVVRTASGTASGATVCTAATGKPYISRAGAPYRIELTCTTVNGSTIKKTNAGSISSSNIPAPVFTVSTNPDSEMYTSYEKYNAGEVSTANDLNGLSVYGINAYFTISNDVLKQLAAELRYKTATGNEMTAASSVNTNSYGEFSIGRLPTGAQTIQIICRFDSASAYSDGFSKTISGIPATYDFGTNAAPSDWTMSNQMQRFTSGSNYTRNGYEIRYYYKSSGTDATRDIYTHKFYTISGTKVTYNAVMCAGQTGGSSSKESTDIDGYVGIVSSTSSPSTSVHAALSEQNWCLSSGKKTKDLGESKVVMPNENMISFSARHSYKKIATQHYVILRSFTIKYEAM